MMAEKLADKENSEFYVRKANYALRKFNKIRRKAKGKVAALCGIISADYSPEEIDITWHDKPSRFDLVNTLINKHGYKNYLEIGCSTDACFQNIAAENKIGVDPFSGGTHRMTSDDFFLNNAQKFDIIFIDGLHTYEQVLKDMVNSLQALSDDGVILVHDCLPRNFYAQLPFPTGGDWNGDVWKAFMQIRSLDEADSALCLIDHGVGVIKKRQNSNKLAFRPQDFKELKYRDLVTNYKNWLNAKSYEEIISFCE